jgi:hypothetical protein
MAPSSYGMRDRRRLGSGVAAHDPRSRFSLVVAIIGLAGVPAVFLPFTSDTSPLKVAAQFPLLRQGPADYFLGGLWWLGVPLTLAILVTLGSVRWIVTGRFSRAECLSAYLAALVAAGCFLSPFVSFLSLFVNDHFTWPTWGLPGWFLVMVSGVGSAAGVCLLWRNARTGVPSAAKAIAAMQIVYAIVAVFCMVAFALDGWQIGAYLVAMTTLAYMAQIVAVSVAAPGHPAPTMK